MAIVDILQYPNPRLNKKGEKVTNFESKEVQQMIDDMWETFYKTENCAALASTQLDFEHPLHITVIDYSPYSKEPICLVNGEWEPLGEEMHIHREGCMSVPAAYEPIKRYARIRVKAQDRHGNQLDFEAEGHLARCIQHELDHLNGFVNVQRLSSIHRERAEKAIKKHYRLHRK